MTSPRVSYGSGYSSALFPDTPIYDSLVAERGTPQIAPIRVPSAYEAPSSYLPALPSALPALPAGPSQSYPSPGPGYGYPQQNAGQQPSPLQQAPLQQVPGPQIPPQAAGPRGYPGQQPQQGYSGYEAMRPAAPRPAPAPAPGPAQGGYQDQYGRPYQNQNGGGY